MKFSSLPSEPVHFVVIRPDRSSLLLAKDGQGRVRLAMGYELVEDHGIKPDTEVQQIDMKKNS